MDREIIPVGSNSEKIRFIIEALMDDTESVLLAMATRIGPWLAPVGPAYFVGRAAYHRLDAWLPIAVAMALAVEAVGIAATHTALKAWTWNETKRKSDPEAPVTLMIWLSLVYFLSALILSILVEVYPDSAVLAPAVFIGLAGVAYVTIAVSTRLNGWQTERDKEATERLTKQEDKKAIIELSSRVEKLLDERNDLAGKLSRLSRQNNGFGPQNLAKAHKAKRSKIDARREKVLALIGQNMTNGQIAEALEVSVGTVKNDRKALNGKVKV